MGKIRIGILGTANIAKRSIIPELLKLTDLFKLEGVASRHKDKAFGIAKDYGLEPYLGYEELITSGKIDALYIPLPNALHYKYVKLALSKGIHVLVEKTLAVSYKEVKELVDLARNKSVLLMENFQFRFHSQMNYLFDLLNSSKLGEIRALNAKFCFPPFPDKTNIRYNRNLGGGALMDAGAYTVKIAHLILGEGLSVCAASLNQTAAYDVDIWGGAYLEQKKSGRLASLTFGFDHYYQCGIEILGSKGKITTNRLFTAPPNLQPIFELEQNGKPKEAIALPADNHFKNMLCYFHRSLTNPEAQEIENLQNLEQSRLIEDIKIKSHG